MPRSRRAHKDMRAAAGERPPHPGSRFPLLFIFLVGVLGLSGYLPRMWREQGGTQSTSGGSPLLKCGNFSWLWPLHTTRPALQGPESFLSPGWEDDTNSSNLRIPKSPLGNLHSSSLSLHLSPLGFQSTLCVSAPWGSSVSLTRSHPTAQNGFLFCFVLLCLIALWCDRKPPYIRVYHSSFLLYGYLYQLFSSSLFCFLGTHKSSLLSTKRALSNENLGFHVYFPWNELQEPVLEKLNTDSFVMVGSYCLPPAARDALASTGGSRNYWEGKIHPAIFLNIVLF